MPKAKAPEFGLFVEGREEPAITASDADMLARLRGSPEFRGARTRVAAADADASKLFPTAPSAPTASGLEQRKAELRSQMAKEQLDKELKSQLKKEKDIGPDEEAMTLLEEGPEEETPQVEETSKIEGPHNAEGETADTLAEVDKL